MAKFKRKKNARTEGGAMISDRDATRADMQQLLDFTASRKGVEAFIEPKTSVTQTTMVLVAADGEWTRRRVESPQAAVALAKKLEIPCYDANRTGYPQRMRDFNVRQAQSQSASKPAATAPKVTQSPKELAAIMTLESIAGAEPLDDNPSNDDLMRLYKSARSKAHPDRLGGERSKWDTVEEAARTLGLPD